MYIFIVKPMGVYCNLRCQYCFYAGCDEEQSQSSTLMDSSILEKLVKEVLSVNRTVAEFNWLGGEPLLAGIDFFNEAVFLQERHRHQGQRIVNKVQTNGTLIDEDWARFFEKHNFSIGISLDGPKWLHDTFRKDVYGKGTYDRIVDGIRLLQRSKLKFGAICVVNSMNVKYPDEVFRAFLGLNITKLAFNHAKGMEDGQPIPLATTVNPIEYARFICRVFDLWLEMDDPKIVVRQVRSVLQALLGGRYRLCTFSNHCHDFFGVSYNGDVFPCEDHPHHKRFSYGNICDGMEAILASPQRKAFQDAVETAKSPCRSCRWWNVCQGGCARDYYLHQEFVQYKNQMCTANKIIFAHISKRLRDFVTVPPMVSRVLR